ncbi:MAG TPA: hypothetical protein VKL99_16495 [Candidatus Angelobacter sp.]|nr:hypothetical protein [Candidatus Angelobacter sp.]
MISIPQFPRSNTELPVSSASVSPATMKATTTVKATTSVKASAQTRLPAR